MTIAEKIDKKIRSRFELKQDEYEKIKLTLIFSFFLGIFVAFYFVPANAEFVHYYGSAQLPYAYILSGIVGSLALLLYSWIQRKTRSKILFQSAIVIMIFISVLAKVGLILLSHNNVVFGIPKLLFAKYLSFFVFIWAWPFIALTATVTGGIAIRLFNLLEIKRYYGLVNLGGVLAAILSYFTISIILKYIGHHYNLILIGDLGLLAAYFLLDYIYKKFPEGSEAHLIQKKNTFKNFLKTFSSKNFLIWIFVGAAFSIIAIYIADYGFLITIKNQKQLFPTSADVAKFMSIVFGLLKIGEFIISIASGRILTKYGLRFGLTFLALTITGFEILAFGVAYTIGVNSIVFLGIMTLNKMAERIIRRGIDDPSFNVLYQTLPENLKLFIQTRVGVVQQAAIALAGVILLIIYQLISRQGHFRLELYPLYTLPVLLTWLFVTIKLYFNYRNRIKQILYEKKLFIFEYVEKDTFALDVLQKHLLTGEVNVAKFSVVVLSETNPKALEPYASFLLKIDDKIIRKAILNNIDATYSEKLVTVIEQIGNQIGFKERELRRLILRALYNLDYSELGDYSFEQLLKLVESPKVRDKILAAKFLHKHRLPDDYALIIKLLESEDKAVKLAAIKIASQRQNPQLHRKIIEFLADPQYNNFLINILIELGDSVLDDLDQIFDNQAQNIQLKIIQIFAKIGSPRAQQLLLKHINYPDRIIQQSIIDALFYCDYQANNETEINLIKQKIFETVENIIWFYTTIKDLAREKNTLKLVQSLDLELAKTQEILFTLLTFLHSKETIELIKTNIIGENIVFAIELIDNFIRPDIKRIIIPIFEKTPLGVKIKRLRHYFYFPALDFRSRLEDILLRDYKKIDIWSKVKALELYGKIIDKQSALSTSVVKLTPPKHWTEQWAKDFLRRERGKIDLLVLLLYHHAEIVFTTAAKILLNIEPQAALKYIEYLPPGRRNKILEAYNHRDFLIDRIKLLKRIYLFYTIPEKSLIELAKKIRTLKKNKDQTITFGLDISDQDILIIIKGRLRLNKSLVYERNSVIIKGLNLPQEAESLTVDKNLNILVINRFEFFNALATDNELVRHLFDRMRF